MPDSCQAIILHPEADCRVLEYKKFAHTGLAFLENTRLRMPFQSSSFTRDQQETLLSSIFLDQRETGAVCSRLCRSQLDFCQCEACFEFVPHEAGLLCFGNDSRQTFRGWSDLAVYGFGLGFRNGKGKLHHPVARPGDDARATFR